MTQPITTPLQDGAAVRVFFPDSTAGYPTLWADFKACSPELAREFDAIGAALAAGKTYAVEAKPSQYVLAAGWLPKACREAAQRAKQ